MPLTLEAIARIEAKMQADRSLPLLCEKCRRKGTLRWAPRSGYNPVVTHACPGPWVLAGWTVVAR
jgi:hypothetical protein